jgi:hypothetical protein
MNTITKTVLTAAAALTLVGSVILTPFTAHGEAAGPAHHRPVGVSHQQTQPTAVATPASVKEPSDGKHIVCTGPKPEIHYTPGGTLTNDTITKLHAAGCTPTDGSAFGWNEPAPDASAPPAPARNRSTTQPSTTIPRVAG